MLSVALLHLSIPVSANVFIYNHKTSNKHKQQNWFVPKQISKAGNYGCAGIKNSVLHLSKFSAYM